MRHQSESMRVGIIDKLRKGFEEVGKKGPYDPITHLEDPTRAKKSVNIWLLKEESRVCVESYQNRLSTYLNLKWTNWC